MRETHPQSVSTASHVKQGQHTSRFCVASEGNRPSRLQLLDFVALCGCERAWRVQGIR